MENLCVFPGSFDPITLGHLDLIRRAAAIFPKVIVAVLVNPDKQGAFTFEERVQMIQTACRDLPKVEVEAFTGLLVDFMRAKDAHVVIRGLRSCADFESEFQMAQVNALLSHHTLETIFLPTAPELSNISSSIVRQVAHFNGDISALVPEAIVPKVSQRLNKQS